MLFPDIIGSQREPVPLFYGDRQPVGENRVVRYRKSVKARWSFSLAWDLLSPAEASLIDAHVIAAAGAHLTFDWFDWTPLHWMWVPVATADGVETVFDLPGDQSSDHEFFVGTSPVPSAFTVDAGAGADGRDRVTFAAAPAAGPLWCNALMRRLFVMTFEADDQPLTRELDSGYWGFSTRLMMEK